MLNTMCMGNIDKNVSKEEIIDALENVGTITSAAMLLGLSYKIFTFLCKKYEIDCEKYKKTKKDYRHITKEIIENEVFTNKKFLSTSSLRKNLIKFGYKLNVCEYCGIKEWNGKALTLEIHHLDGNRYNNKLDNLVIICPNCHSQTEHFRGKNKLSTKEKAAINIEHKPYKRGSKKPNKVKKEEIKKICRFCGKEFSGRNKSFCSRECCEKFASKNVLDKDTLLKLIPNFKSLRSLSNSLNISDNTIKKWIKKYNIDIYSFGYRKLGDKSNNFLEHI